MIDEIEKQEEIVAEALSELERLSEVTEAKRNEWDAARNIELKAFDVWLVETKILLNMEVGDDS